MVACGIVGKSDKCLASRHKMLAGFEYKYKKGESYVASHSLMRVLTWLPLHSHSDLDGEP